MKRFATVMAVLAALVLALAFTGCKNNPSVVSEWKATKLEMSIMGSTNRTDMPAPMTLVFYDNGTVDYTISGATVSGTYEGDTTKAGANIKADIPSFPVDGTISSNGKELLVTQSSTSKYVFEKQ